MSSSVVNGGLPTAACGECERRSWLLSALSPSLDYRAHDRPRLLDLLSLEDEELIRALAGRRREELYARYQAFEPERAQAANPVHSICRHLDSYPSALLRHRSAPRLLNVAGESERLGRTTLVAIVGSRGASDYGVQMARSLARGLTSCGVGVVSGLGDGIAAAALGGALIGGGWALAVLGNGLGVPPTTRRQALHRRLAQSGCAVSELPHACSGRRWGAVAAERTIAAMARLTVVVEAEEKAEDLAVAGLARAHGDVVAAMPGRITSPLSRGTHALLIDGAHLVRGAEDVLELLHLAGSPVESETAGRSEASTALEPRLAHVLWQVGTGKDTPDKLARPGVDVGDVLPALSELELLGLLTKGEGGRYVPRHPCG